MLYGSRGIYSRWGGNPRRVWALVGPVMEMDYIFGLAHGHYVLKTLRTVEI